MAPSTADRADEGRKKTDILLHFRKRIRYNKHSIHSITTWSYLTQYMLMVTWHQGRVIAAVSAPNKRPAGVSRVEDGSEPVLVWNAHYAAGVGWLTERTPKGSKIDKGSKSYSRSRSSRRSSESTTWAPAAAEPGSAPPGCRTDR